MSMSRPPISDMVLTDIEKCLNLNAVLKVLNFLIFLENCQYSLQSAWKWHYWLKKDSRNLIYLCVFMHFGQLIWKKIWDSVICHQISTTIDLAIHVFHSAIWVIDFTVADRLYILKYKQWTLQFGVWQITSLWNYTFARLPIRYKCLGNVIFSLESHWKVLEFLFWKGLGTLPEIWLFQNSALKIQCQGCSWRSFSMLSVP